MAAAAAGRGLMPGATPTPTHRATTNKRGSTRNRMLFSAAEVLREKGAAGVTIDAGPTTTTRR